MTNKVGSKLLIIAAACLSTAANAQQPAKIATETVEAYVKKAWKSPPEGWQARVDQDQTQRVCSETRNNPSQADAAKIQARELATVVFPVDGKVVGDWKRGEAVAQIGTDGQFSDKPDGPKGGNCYACHQMAAKELSYGTLGPSLLEYGKVRKFDSKQAKATYAKVFNAQSVVPCSNMPRFGYHKFLTEQQLQDVTAYLFDPESPVNKP